MFVYLKITTGLIGCKRYFIYCYFSRGRTIHGNYYAIIWNPFCRRVFQTKFRNCH